MRLLNTGNKHAAVGTFFELLNFFDNLDNSVNFTKNELQKLLLSPAKQGHLDSLLDFACELELLELSEDGQKYTKGQWLSLWKSDYTHQQLRVLFFVKLSSKLKRWNLHHETALKELEQKDGADLIVALCWILILRPHHLGFGDVFNDHYEGYLNHHRNYTKGLMLTAKLSKESFRNWSKALGLLGDKYAPMNIFSDSMLEYIRSLDNSEKITDIRYLLNEHLFLFSQDNPIIQNLYTELRNNQVKDELAHLEKWSILSSVAWSLRQREEGRTIKLEPFVPDGLPAVVFDPELTNDGVNKFGSVDWSLTC